MQAADFIYLITPFITWFITGLTKFTVNSIRAQNLDFKNIGYGGFPSNHSAIVSSIAALIGFREGISQPAFGVAIALAFIVILDASSLRRQISQQAQRINKLEKPSQNEPLRERIGHSKSEILAGIALGTFCAYWINYFL